MEIGKLEDVPLRELWKSMSRELSSQFLIVWNRLAGRQSFDFTTAPCRLTPA